MQSTIPINHKDCAEPYLACVRPEFQGRLSIVMHEYGWVAQFFLQGVDCFVVFLPPVPSDIRILLKQAMKGSSY